MNTADFNGMLPLLLFTTLLGLLPLAAMLLTAYIKISIVLLILRNAIGLQQTPGNLVLNSLALILSFYLSLPLVNDIYEAVRSSPVEMKTVEDIEATMRKVVVPVRDFLKSRVPAGEVEFFHAASRDIWANSKISLDQSSLALLMPAFVLHELTAGFKIGFLLYLPFLAIDLIVSNVLMAFGMMMLSPVVVSVPFKLLLFVMIDGWNLVVRNLILSYAT